VSDFFAAGYRLFFDDTQGPRLGEFLGELERDYVVAAPPGGVDARGPLARRVRGLGR